MYRILICDDQKDIVNALKIYLTPEGYDLYEAYNGQEAVELCRKTPMDLILLDVMMEEGFYDTGDEFARTKRAMIERGDTKIMAIDSTKFEKSAFAKVMDTEDIDMIITDRKPQKTVLKVCEEKGIKCMYPEK